MTASDVIPRVIHDPDGLDFATLRSDGIALAQALAGTIWTDYNLHDPGVTILEQLCFGMTELAYQADVPVADLLANQHGVIDYHRYGLLKPHEIFPSAPVTPEDYCKLLIDAVPEIDQINFIPVHNAHGNRVGLYRVTIKLLEPLTGLSYNEEQKNLIKKSVKDVYLHHRNLGEDIDTVHIEQADPCFLMGRVETNGKRNIAEIYADIFFQCSQKISSNIHIDRYEEVFRQKKPLEDIFCGPLTQHGYISQDSFAPVNTTKALEELSGIVANIPGVKKVYELGLVDAYQSKISSEDLGKKAYFVRFPEQGPTLLNIHFNPGKTAVPEDLSNAQQKITQKLLAETLRYLQKLEFEYRAFRNNKVNAGNFYQLPGGNNRQQQYYYSIQHHFPDVYGINAAGVPRSESLQRKHHAQQLKSYLYPFDQMMANFLQLLQELHRLFSLNEKSHLTYFAEYLDNTHIPNMVELYKNPDLSVADIRSIQANYDKAIDRKNRALDSLLALYGEEFAQEGLLHFNDYHQDKAGYWTIDNKIHYLRHIQELSARRHGAFTTCEEHWNTTNVSGIHKKLAILLGIKEFSSIRSLGNLFAQRNMRTVTDDTLANSTHSVAAADIKYTAIAGLDTAQAELIKEWSYKPASTPLTISPTILTRGVNIDMYKLVEKDNNYSVYIDFEEHQRLVLLSTFSSKEKATLYAHKFKKIITELNVDSEGFFILEHILLRPRQQSATGKPATDKEFFNSQLSFIFPAWTARFANPAFRQFAQKTLCQNLPAHLFPHIYWVEIADLTQFETLYQQWLEALYDFEQIRLVTDKEDIDSTRLDSVSQTLMAWLNQHQSSHDYWM